MRIMKFPTEKGFLEGAYVPQRIYKKVSILLRSANVLYSPAPRALGDSLHRKKREGRGVTFTSTHTKKDFQSDKGSLGIDKHAHADAGFLALLLTILAYRINWVSGWKVPDSIFVRPRFIAVLRVFTRSYMSHFP